MTNPLDNPYATILAMMDEVYGPGGAQSLKDCGGPWEYYIEGWSEIDNTSWHEGFAYRRAPAEQDIVPWDSIEEGWDWYARDDDDTCFVFDSRPKLNSGWFSGPDARLVDHIIGHEIGTVDWKDSLQRRPGK